MNPAALSKLSAGQRRSNPPQPFEGLPKGKGRPFPADIGPPGQNNTILSEDAQACSEGISCAPFLIGDAAEGETGQRNVRAEPPRESVAVSVVCPSGLSAIPETAPNRDRVDARQSQLVTSADNATASVSETSGDRLENGHTAPVHRPYAAGVDASQRSLEALWRESIRPRQRNCRRVPSGTSTGTVDVYRSDRGTYFTGLQTCGHSTCPVCGPLIRERERDRVQELVASHLDAGGSVYLFLLTLSHGPKDRLGDLLDALDAGRSAAIGGKGGSRWAKDRRDYGIEGTSWHREEVHGRNGWHPHVHGLLLTSRDLTDGELDALQSRIYGRHLAALKARGYRAQAAWNGIQRVHSPDAVADYLTKQDRMARRIAAEMTRGDLKQGKGLTPGAILYRFSVTGDVDDLDTFRDYESACEGRRWRYLSPALAKRYAIDAEAEATCESAEEQDRADAQETVGGTLAVQVPVGAWRVLTRTLGAVSTLRRLVHAGDVDGTWQLVARAVRESERRPPDRESVRRSRGQPSEWSSEWSHGHSTQYP